MQLSLKKARYRCFGSRFALVAGCALAIALAGGCAVTQIPYGQWRGEGAFYEYESSPLRDNKDITELPAGREHGGCYTTELAISAVEYFQTACLLVEIQTHQEQVFDKHYHNPKFRLVLIPRDSSAGGFRTYGGTGLDFDEPQATVSEEDFRKGRSLPFAVSYPCGDSMILEVNYMPGGDDGTFSDTFIFSPGGVAKIGRMNGNAAQDGSAIFFRNRKQVYSSIHWVEQLQPVR